MRVGSLFSGIGAFDLGFERAGMQVVWQCEIDAACQTVLRRHWPGVRMYDDVRAVGADAGAVDVICGGFPCQDVSVAGRRAGLAGERSGLWHEFHRVLQCLRPQWVVVENVPGLLSSNRGRDFATVIQGLVELGYGVCWRVLDSQYHGVAQRRRRVFVVGHLGDGRAAEVLFERESLCRNPAEGRKAGQGATPILEAGARTGSGTPAGAGIGNAGDPMFTLQAAHQHAVAPPLTGNGVGAGRTGNERNEVDFCIPVARPLGHNTGGSRQDLDNDTYVTHALTAEGADASEDGTGRGTPLVAACLQERDAKGADSDTKPGHLITTEAGKTGKGDSAQCVAAHSTVRRLTPTEAERLQGFPDGWTGGQADSPRYRQLGNAVTVNVAEWIGRRIMEAER